ncbi:MAG: excalibur calcium-binding domain-containing protein [Patescibacteria group bacterium]
MDPALKNGLIGAGIAGVLLVGGYSVLNSPNPEEAYIRTDNPTETRTSLSTGEADKDCKDFSTQSQAQEFFEKNGGPDSDPHNLDRDGDGRVCESLP